MTIPAGRAVPRSSRNLRYIMANYGTVAVFVVRYARASRGRDSVSLYLANVFANVSQGR